jgi:cytoskeletal protein CcmA (bactofilin family)
VGGSVPGNIEATENLEMLASGQVYGNVRTAKLKIADGVIFEGKCEMIREPESVDIFSATAEQLKATIPVV